MDRQAAVTATIVITKPSHTTQSSLNTQYCGSNMKVIQMHKPPERNAQLDEKVPWHTKLESEWLTWKICDRPAFGDASCSSTCSPDWSFIMALEWLSYNFTCTDNHHTFILKYIYVLHVHWHPSCITKHTYTTAYYGGLCMYVHRTTPPEPEHGWGLALPAVDSGHNSSPVWSWVAGRLGRHPSSVVAWREGPACAGPPSQEHLHRTGTYKMRHTYEYGNHKIIIRTNTNMYSMYVHPMPCTHLCKTSASLEYNKLL